MQNEGISPHTINFICIFKAGSIARDVEMGIKIHVKIVSKCFPLKDIALGNALVDMYAKCGLIIKAQDVLEELPVRDVVSWNIMIDGCVQNEQNNKALRIYEQMRSEGLALDS